jgi:hypothetical protein
MTFKVTFNESTHIIESRVHEDFDWNLIEHMVPEIGKLVQKENSDLIFIDFRDSKVTMSTIKIYETPRKIADEFSKTGVNVRKLKRAILINPNQKDFDFLDSVTANNAQILRLFYDEESAMKWLTTIGSINN